MYCTAGSMYTCCVCTVRATPTPTPTPYPGSLESYSTRRLNSYIRVG